MAQFRSAFYGQSVHALKNIREAADIRAMRPLERAEVFTFCCVVPLAAAWGSFATAHGLTVHYQHLSSSFTTSGMLGALLSILICAHVHPWLRSGLTGAVPIACLLGFLNAGKFANSYQALVLPGLVTAMVFLLGSVIFGSRHEVRRRLLVLCRSALFVLGTTLVPFFLGLSQPSATLDGPLLWFDAELGIRIPSLALGALFTLPPVAHIVQFVYVSVVAGLMVQEALLKRDDNRGSLVCLFLFSAVVGGIFYAIFPAVGPPFFTEDYYYSILSSAPLSLNGQIDPGVLRNCMPSMHAAWAYIMFSKARDNRDGWARAGLQGFAVLTVLGALTFGGHWFIDTVVAMPVAVAILAAADFDLSAAPTTRLGVFAVGMAMAAAWLVLLALKPSLSLMAAWTLIVVTTLSSYALHQYLRSRPLFRARPLDAVVAAGGAASERGGGFVGPAGP